MVAFNNERGLPWAVLELRPGGRWASSLGVTPAMGPKSPLSAPLWECGSVSCHRALNNWEETPQADNAQALKASRHPLPLNGSLWLLKP